jgi:hypothetical protein
LCQLRHRKLAGVRVLSSSTSTAMSLQDRGSTPIPNCSFVDVRQSICAYWRTGRTSDGRRRDVCASGTLAARARSVRTPLSGFVCRLVSIVAMSFFVVKKRTLVCFFSLRSDERDRRVYVSIASIALCPRPPHDRMLPLPRAAAAAPTTHAQPTPPPPLPRTTATTLQPSNSLMSKCFSCLTLNLVFTDVVC